MFKCHVCHSIDARETLVSEMFEIDGKFYLVENIPATVCSRCGEEVFSREIAERIRSMLHGQAKLPISRCFNFSYRISYLS